MKRPDRTLNIFSLSALDLFASAMGTFVLIAIILFPYYQKNSKILAQVRQSSEQLRKTRAESQRLSRENRRLGRANKSLNRRVAELERMVRELKRQIPKVRVPVIGEASVWLYGSLRFSMYEYPSPRAGNRFIVGIAISNSSNLPIKRGDIVMVANRHGNRIEGDLWGWNRVCFFRSFSHKFTATLAADGRSMAVRRSYVTLRAPQGRNGPCIINHGNYKSFQIRRAN
ncbi:MAG: hypothetical protein ACTSUD_04415 [Alphaproteobacteria bacterium]